MSSFTKKEYHIEQRNNKFLVKRHIRLPAKFGGGSLIFTIEAFDTEEQAKDFIERIHKINIMNKACK